MRINQNIAAFNAYRNLNNTQNSLSSSLEKLSSGFRINRAADDASGLVNSENLRSQIGGLKVATRNAQDAISLVQTAEGAQTEVHSILQRMRDLTVQSGNLGTNDNAALDANQNELEELVGELNRISEQTQFGTKQILAGERATSTTAAASGAVAATDTPNDATYAPGSIGTGAVAGATAFFARVNSAFALTGTDFEVTTLSDLKNFEVTENVGGAVTTLYDTVTNPNGTLDTNAALSEGDTVSTIVKGESNFVFQVGANAEQTASVTVNGVNASSLGVTAAENQGAGFAGTTGSGIWIGQDASEENVAAALRAIDKAIGDVSENRATLGAFQNRMESTIRNVSVAVENLSAAESRIRDTDMALEMVEFTRNQILSQAGTAMLAQANVVPQSVLSLLG